MNLQHLQHQLQPIRNQLLAHPLFEQLHTPEQLRCFMEYHVFAVWDFMSLLKALQHRLTGMHLPWQPAADPELCHLINDIVLAEESDTWPDGRHGSHFELYLEAMRQAGAHHTALNELLALWSQTRHIQVAINQTPVSQAVKDFLSFTFRTIDQGKTHQIAAAFTFGREDVIPGMFTGMIHQLQQQFPNENLSTLIYYLERHIDLDADEHGPMALEMLTRLCGHDAQAWEEATQTAIEALQLRIGLWDAVAEAISETVEA